MTALHSGSKTGSDSEPFAATMASFSARFGWAMFDWANQPYFTVITTFIFAPYFTSTVVGDPVRGQALWGYSQSIAGLVVAIMSPFLGAIADAGGPRKPWIAVFQILCFVGCFALWWAPPAASDAALYGLLAALVVAAIGAEFSIVFNNAMLPCLVPSAYMGRLSGYAWALGYFGGLVALVVILVGFSLPATPWFGLDKLTHEQDRIVGPLSAVWLALFVLPMFLLTPDTKPSGLALTEAIRMGGASVLDTIRSLKRYRNIMLFMIARMIAYDGLSTAFAFGGVYAAGIFRWNTVSLGIFGIVLTIFAGIGAWIGGILDDRIGSKRTMQAGVLGVTFSTLGIISITTDSIFFGLPVPGPAVDGGLFSSVSEQVFLGFGILLGIFGGPMQAASRTMVARLSPPSMIGAFYGLYALTGKATAFIAPFALAVVTDALVSQRAGLVVIFVFLVIGYLLMVPVREEQARA